MTYDDNTTASQVKKVGTIVRDWYDKGVRILIMRGPAAWCVYLGIPEDHPLAGFAYDDLPIDCHGGLTFSAQGGGTYNDNNKKPIPHPWPKDFWWYGYDYAHFGDKMAFEYPDELKKHEAIANIIELEKNNKDWTIKQIEDEAWSAIWSMQRLIKLAEKITSNSKTA